MAHRQFMSRCSHAASTSYYLSPSMEAIDASFSTDVNQSVKMSMAYYPVFMALGIIVNL